VKEFERARAFHGITNRRWNLSLGFKRAVRGKSEVDKREGNVDVDLTNRRQKRFRKSEKKKKGAQGRPSGKAKAKHQQNGREKE